MINTSSLFGSAFVEVTRYVTGDIFITLLLIFFMFIFLAGIFKADFFWLIIMMTPLAIYFMSVDTRFYAVGGLWLVLAGFMLLRYFWFNPR